MSNVRIKHRESGTVLADGPLGWGITPFEGNAMIWNLDMDTWVDVACRAAGRDMTRPEWEMFGPRDAGYRTTCTDTQTEESPS